MLPLTVLITCKDEAANIAACIESARALAAEVLVADSGSTDGTLDIVRRLGGCRIIEREYVHAGDFKNWAIPQAKCPWVLILDADERLTPALRAEVASLLSAEPAHDGYWIYRENYFLGHRVTSCGWGRDKVLRLFRRDAGRYAGDTDHAEIKLPPQRVAYLKEKMLHYSYWSYDQYMRKLDRYTRYQAEVWHKQGRKPSYFHLLSRGPLRFLRAYFIDGGIREGKLGLQLAILTGFASFLKQARLWEIWHARRQEEIDRAASASDCLRKAA